MTERTLARLHDLLDGRDFSKCTHLLDISHWRETCDVTLTLKQALKSDDGRWVKIDQYQCRRAFRHFMNLLNRAIYGNPSRQKNSRYTRPRKGCFTCPGDRSDISWAKQYIRAMALSLCSGAPRSHRRHRARTSRFQLLGKSSLELPQNTDA